ncbi:PQQ-binding-like beta-propeller repeat protein [Enorma phocaeensis]|uniref:PQQ-binding-like beta-propeller repeat protein n=1 Tax=Enorma phocaeensis TaxID=1871019 RepID=A0A921LSX3_9ACTN|nr:PQQ-binding-like beta-propeller repeat protein [Enorma phocaeensis]HJG36677.1 PQQ-binding-like beta-propeller repeat protein [Enorma phocaeensis]
MDERIDMNGEPAGDNACRYEAFISYSHTEYDARVAREVQRFIEGFPVPARLREGMGRSRLGKVFRDEDELAAGTSLDAGLAQALAASRWLIVVCSPAAAASPWVAREIEAFVAMHGAGRVLAVLASGEPAEAFPPALVAHAGPVAAGATPGAAVDAFVANGVPLVGQPGGGEPIAADLRTGVPWRRRRSELLRLTAPIIGCPYDELAQRQRARACRRIGAAALAACAVAALAGGLAFFQQQRVAATEELAHAQSAAAKANEAYAAGDRMAAIGYALETVPSNDDFIREAQASSALAGALGVYHPIIDTVPQYRIDGVVDASTLVVSDTGGARGGGWLAVLDSPDRIMAYDLETGAPTELTLDGKGGGGSFSGYLDRAEGLLLAPFDDRGLACFDVAAGELLWTQRDLEWVAWIEPLGDGRIAVAGTPDGEGYSAVIDLSTGEVVQEVTFEWSEKDAKTIAIGVTGDTVAVATGGSLAVWDLATGAVRYGELAAPDVTGIVLSADAIYTVSSDLASDGAEDSWQGAMTACAYRLDDLSLAWSFERSWAPYQIDFSQLPFNGDASIHPVEDSAALGRTVVPFTAGSHALLVDAATGEVIVDVAAEGTIVQFHYVNSDGGEVLRAIDITGKRYAGAVAEGSMEFMTVAGYRFPTFTWHAEEIQVGPSRYAVACSAEETEVIYVYRDDLVIPQEPGVELVEGIDAISGISVSADGSRAAIYDGTGTITVLSGENFEPSVTIDLAAQGIEFANNGQTLITFPDSDSDVLVVCDPGGGTTPPRAWQFDAATGELLASWRWPYEVEGVRYDGCTFSSERAGYVTLSFPAAGYLGLLDTEALEVVEEFTVDGYGISDVMLVNPDRYLFVYESGIVGLYDRASMDLVGEGLDGLTFESECDTAQIAIAPDGSAVATVTPEEGLALIDAGSGELLWSVPLDVGFKEFVVFSPDGAMVLAQDTNGTVGFYSVEDGTLIAQTDAVEALIKDARFSDDGTLVYLSTTDTVQWNVEVLALDAADGELAVAARIPQAWGVSEQGGRVLVQGSVLYTQPLYSLDELVEFAEETLAAHEGR